MNLYEINQKLIDTIESQCDLETGELLEGANLEEAVNEIQMEVRDKVENIGAFIKNLESDIVAFDNEISTLTKRKKQKEKTKEFLKNYLKGFLLNQNIDKFESPRVKIGFRKSKTVNVLDIRKVPRVFIKEKEVIVEESVDKNMVKAYLKEHKDATVAGVELVENKNINIK